MAIFYNLNNYIPDKNGSSVALGFFDGVHLGHRSVVESCAGAGLRRLALTFADSPSASLGLSSPPLLTDNSRKADLLTSMGIDDIIFADFSELRDMSAEEFVRDVLIEKLMAKRVCCGFNYRFGQGGRGDTAALKKMCERFGAEAVVNGPVLSDGEQISSTRIRELIQQGDTERANGMLGYRYSISGEIAGGNHLGSELGFPTVNIPIPDGLVIPRFGVYASAVRVGGSVYSGATNIGVHPTAGANDSPLCETFLLDYNGESLYGKRAECELAAFIRDEKHFDSIGELKRQIAADCEIIRKTSITSI